MEAETSDNLVVFVSGNSYKYSYGNRFLQWHR